MILRLVKTLGFAVAAVLLWMLGWRLMGPGNFFGRGELGLGLLFGGAMACGIASFLALINRLPRISEDWPYECRGK